MIIACLPQQRQSLGMCFCILAEHKKYCSMIRHFIFLLFAFLAYQSGFGQTLNNVSFRDLAQPYIELNTSKYGFDFPIDADVLDSTNFTPPTDGIYLLAGFGHRYLATASNVSDNHGGYDFWPYQISNGNVYNNTNLTPINCMCDGYISTVIHGPDSVMELLGTGRSVQVTCDSVFQSFGSNVVINYRHLSALGTLASIADTATSTIAISKGDTIGIIGASGLTSNIHLHLSTQTIHPVYGSAFVNADRLFEPSATPGIITALDDANIELLHDWPDSALFRVIWPYNQTINNFEFINGNDTVVFNKEAAYNTGSANRDKHDCLPNIKVYAYQFNGNLTAEARYLNEMNNMPPNYPASPNRDNLPAYGYNHIPITADSIAFVYDFVVQNLNPNHSIGNFKVKLSDVWGYTVEGTSNFPTYATDSIVACNSYMWTDGNVYTTNNSSATDTFVNSINGDSIVTLNLTINSIDTFVNNAGNTLIANQSGGTYQWLDCDAGQAPIVGAIGQAYQTMVTGNFAVEISKDGCVDTSSCHYIIIESIAENDWKHLLTIAPNPTSGTLVVHLDKQHATIGVKVLDVLGKTLQEEEYSNVSSIPIALDGPTGLYFLEIEDDTGQRAVFTAIKE